MGDTKGKGKEVAGKSSSGKRKPPRPSGGETSGSRKHRRSGVLRFFDDIADVDDDDDEDNDSDSDLLSDDGMDLEDDEKQHKGNPLPFFLKEEVANDLEIEKFVRERYKQGSKYVSYAEEAKGFDEENSSMQFNGDPVMWKVKCTRGHERELVVCLIQKFIDLHSVGKKMDIKSAFCLDNIKGYIYFEADRDCDIVEACKGLFGIYTNTMIHIPNNELSYLFSARGASMEVFKGAWVRVKHGIYKGDLAKVIDVDDRRKSATIKLVPRVDLQSVVNKIVGNTSIKKGTAVPPPHLISAYELERLQQFVKLKRNQRTGELFQTIGGLTLKDGFVYKKVRLESLNCWDVRASDIELEQFKDSKRVKTKDHLWLSKLYGERRNDKSKEVNKVDNGKGSSLLVSCEMKEWELFDLVFFEKKRFGVIIGIEGGSFQILKGNCERLETTTVAMRDIKQQQLEAQDTALDHNSNLISLNDVVRIRKGPFKGKQGIVKHIIQGILFIYDKNQKEANGFCCAQTNKCEAIKYSNGPSDESFFRPVPPGFEASAEPVPEEPQENSGQRRERPAAAGFRSRSSNGDFYVGQTLRIRVGPLKGYLCRVIDAYRSDITVKLDSQMKVIKVKVEDVTVVVAKGCGSVARDEWTGIPSASADLPGSDDANTGLRWKLPDQRTICTTGEQQTTKTSLDSWGEPPAVSQGNGSEQALDGWNQKRDESENQNDSWNRPAMQWNETEVMSTDQVDGWGKPASESNKTDGMMSSEGWGKDVGGWANARDRIQNRRDDKDENWKEPTNQWDKEAAACGQADSWPRGAGGWNNERDARSPNDNRRQSWDKKEVAGRGGTCSWGKAGGGWSSEGDQSDVKTHALEKTQSGLDDQAECRVKPTGGWHDKMGNTSTNNWEGWNEQLDKAGVAAEDKVDFYGRGQAKEKGANLSHGASWNEPSNTRNKLTGADGGRADCWGFQHKEKDASSGQGDGWGKAKITEGNQGDGWSKASDGQQEDKGATIKLLGGWDRTEDQCDKGEDAVGNQVSYPEKAPGGWDKQTDASGSQAGSWYSGCNQNKEAGSDWQKSGGWPESRLVGGSVYGGRNRSNHVNGSRSEHQRMERAPGRGRGRGRWNGRGDGADKWRRPVTESSDNAHNYRGHQLGGWKQSQGWKNVIDASGERAGGWGGSWGEGETEGNDTLDGWKNTFESKNTAADASGKDAGGWRVSSGSQTWDKQEYADRNTLNQEAGGWGMSSAPQSQKHAESGDGNSSDGWGKAAEGRNIAADMCKNDVLGVVSSESQGLEKKESAGWNATDASRIDTEAENRAVDTSKEDDAWGKYSTSQSWDKKENAGGDASDGWGKGPKGRNDALDKKMDEAGGWEKASGFQPQDKTENVGGKTSGGWGDLVEVGKDSTDESSKGQGGWGKLSGSQGWGGSSSGGGGKAAECWEGVALASTNEVGGWGKANGSSGSQGWGTTEVVKGKASGGWGDFVEVGKDSTDESSKGQGGWGKLSGSQGWGGSSSGGGGKAEEGWDGAVLASTNEVGAWAEANASSRSQGWGTTEIANANKADSWGNVEDGWHSTSNLTKGYTDGDWTNSAPTSFEKVNNWQQSAESGEDSKAMHEGGSDRWNRPRFGDSGRAGYPHRGRGPRRADGRGLSGRGPSDVNDRGRRGRGSFDRFSRGCRGRGLPDGNRRGAFRGRGPYDGNTRNWNGDDDCGQSGNWSKPEEPQSPGGNHRWNRADEGSHKSASWSSWSTASGSGQANDNRGRQMESQNQGGNQQRNRTDPGGDESGSWSPWPSASGGWDQAKDGNGGSGW